jgi:kynurenine 3-monooxygenase
MEPGALHIWPRGGFMMIALPNRDGSFTCTLFWPFAGPNSFEAIKSDQDLLQFFRNEFPDALPLMPTLAEDYRENPVGSMVTVKCAPWHRGGRVVLVGDAAHAIVPFYGQGMNAAFEDCVVLAECLARGGDPVAALDEYEERRRPNADAIADLAVENFHEMRDHVASPLFRLKKRGERILHRVVPFWYVPLYHMVSFTRIPYAAAVERAERQRQALVIMAFLALVVIAFFVPSWLRAFVPPSP